MATHRITYAGDLGWGNGEAPSKYAGSPASHDPASVGIDIFRTVGGLQTGFTGTEIGGSNVTDNITQMEVATIYDGSSISREVFAYGTAGKLYRITDATTPSVTVIATITNNVDGIRVFKDYLYYAQKTQIGRYGILNATTPTTDDDFLTGLTGTVKGQTIKHPMTVNQAGGTLYVGDANKVKTVAGSETGPTSGTTVLTFDSDMIITSMFDTGTSLLIGAGYEPVEDTQSKVPAWLFTWNFVTTDTAESVQFPEPYIHNIQVVDGETYCFGLKYLYKLVGNTFKIVTKLDSRIALGGSDIHKGQLWFKGSNDIRAIGTPDPQLPVARYRPIGATGTSITALKWVQDSKLWVADNNDLNEYKTGSQTGKTWYSRMISFRDQESVEEVRVYLAQNLASGDDLRVQIVDEVGNATTVATCDFATYGAVNELTFKAHRFTNGIANRSAMQIALLFNGGAPVVREVVVVTKPVAQP